jgi:hypothetical protein
VSIFVVLEMNRKASKMQFDAIFDAICVTRVWVDIMQGMQKSKSSQGDTRKVEISKCGATRAQFARGARLRNIINVKVFLGGIHFGPKQILICKAQNYTWRLTAVIIQGFSSVHAVKTQEKKISSG